MQHEFFQRAHESQISRSEHYSNQLALLVTGLSLMFALFGYLAGNFKSCSAWERLLFWTPLSIAAILACVSVFYLVRTYYVSQLVDLAPANVWHQHLMSLMTKKPDGNGAAKEFTEDLVEKYAAAAAHNQYRNDIVGTRMEGANRFLVASLCIALISIPAYVYSGSSGGSRHSDHGKFEEFGECAILI